MILKRICVSMVAVAMTVSFIPVVVFAKEADSQSDDTAIIEIAGEKSVKPAKLETGSAVAYYEGKCGKNLKWKLYTGNGKLVISGSGAMYNYGKGKAPWYKHRSIIKTVSISGGTTIGNYAFFNCNALTKVSGGSKITIIGKRAFSYCSKLSSFTITSKKLKKIGAYAFTHSNKLKTISIKKTTKLTFKGIKKCLKGSKVKTVKVKKSKRFAYRVYFKVNSGRKSVKVK